MAGAVELQDVVRRAREEAGTELPLPDGIAEQLEAWLTAIEAVPMAAPGREAMSQMTHRHVLNRLRFQQALISNPEILDEDVSDPIVIIGFPRSGTTVLQRMLSADPAVQCLAFWRVLNPAEFPDEAGGKPPKDRIAFGQAVEDAIKTASPALFSAHPSVALDAEEDWFLHHLNFGHIANICLGPFTRDYYDYLQTLPREPTYREAANLLRYLQWQDGGRKGRPWVLKSPAHIGYIEEMLAIHPRATFVYPRRDFETVMASFCHTLELSLSLTHQPDPHFLGRLSFDLWLGEMQRFYASRERLGDKLKLIEIPYQEMLADPVASIRAIHRQAGRELDRGGEDAIRQWVVDNPAGKHGKNVYSLERYGLSPNEVLEAFGNF